MVKGYFFLKPSKSYTSAPYFGRFFFKGCTILVSGGKKIKGGETSSSSFKMELYFTGENVINEIRLKEMPDMPQPSFGNFKCVCEGRFIFGGGHNDRNTFLSDVLEFADIQEWKYLPSLKEARSYAASCFVRGKFLVVGGGLGDNYNWLDSIEVLRVEKCDNDLEWTINSKLKMPSVFKSPTFNYLRGKIILAGTRVDDSSSLVEMWEGTLVSKQQIDWRRIASPGCKRSEHMSVVVKNKIYMFGGTCSDKDEIEIFDGNEWEKGPKMPFELSTKNAQSVVDDRGRIIITTNYNGIIVYDTNNDENYGNIIKQQEDSHQAKLQWYSTFA